MTYTQENYDKKVMPQYKEKWRLEEDSGEEGANLMLPLDAGSSAVP